jgi:hypothetical protein
VIIHLVDTTRSDKDAQVVDPDANGNPDDSGAMWLPGEAFVDSANGISVSILSATSQGFVVTVNNGSSGPTSYTLSMTVTGSGMVTSNPAGIACSAGTCSASFPSGTGVTLTPSGGSLTGWGGACTGTGTCSVTMTANRAASATFSAAPDITVSPLVIEFGSGAIGTKGPGRTVTVRNDGAAPLVLGALTLDGLNPDQFLIVVAGNLCGGRTLAIGESCTVVVKLKPTTAGAKVGKLRIPSNDPDEAVVKVTLRGTGI